jgi:N-acetylmuramoyl-L-alanine amidase
MPIFYPGYDAYDDLHLLALCVWREARGEIYDAKFGVACSIRNRVNHPTWWGHNYHEVILEKWQYTSFDPSDPNSKKFPQDTDHSYVDCLKAAAAVIGGAGDTTSGASSYFDRSLDTHPPKWATDGSNVHTVDVGHLHFYERKQDIPHST